jgi:hypothetical protein
MRSKSILIVVMVVLFAVTAQALAVPMGTAFTYQGRIIDANSPADGLYDFKFKLYDDANTITGNQMGSDVNKPDVDVIDGYFTLELDFSGSVFDGNSIWLEIDVRPGESNDPNAFITLSPRQEVTPTPYALHTRGMFLDELSNNTFVGFDAGANNTTSHDNTFVGQEAGFWNTEGNYNTFSGFKAGFSNTTGSYNTFSGTRAGHLNSTGGGNTFSGYEAGYYNTEGGHNTFLGRFAGFSNTTSSYNTIVGSDAGRYNTTGNTNTFLGSNAGHSNTTGSYNTFVGTAAGILNTTGSWNTFLGKNAGGTNTTGKHNAAIGPYANYYNQEGSRNTIIGYEAGKGVVDHNMSGNVFLGYRAGSNETDSNKLYIANSEVDPPLIYGEFDTGKIGIGTMSPAATIDVNGTLALENGPPINEVSTDGTLEDNSDLAVPTEQAVKTYVDSQVVSAGVGVVPVGGITAWLKSYPNTPSLPDRWVECNGQTLTDSNSPYDGQVLPDLNGGSGTQRFLRGATASGVTGGSENHTHGVTSSGFPHGTGSNLPTSNTNQTLQTSTLPSYYEVVWIMRIK